MRLKFLYDPKDGLPVSDSFGHQKIIASIIDDGSIIVCFVDNLASSYYIERVINKFLPDMFQSSNFQAISDEEWNTYNDFLLANGMFKNHNKNKLSEDEIIATSRQ